MLSGGIEHWTSESGSHMRLDLFFETNQRCETKQVSDHVYKAEMFYA